MLIFLFPKCELLSYRVLPTPGIKWMWSAPRPQWFSCWWCQGRIVLTVLGSKATSMCVCVCGSSSEPPWLVCVCRSVWVRPLVAYCRFHSGCRGCNDWFWIYRLLSWWCFLYHWPCTQSGSAHPLLLRTYVPTVNNHLAAFGVSEVEIEAYYIHLLKEQSLWTFFPWAVPFIGKNIRNT